MSTGVLIQHIEFYLSINVREYRRGNQKWAMQRNWQHWLYKTKKDKSKKQNTQYAGHNYAQTNINTTNKTQRPPTNN